MFHFIPWYYLLPYYMRLFSSLTLNYFEGPIIFQRTLADRIDLEAIFYLSYFVNLEPMTYKLFYNLCLFYFVCKLFVTKN